MKEKLLQTAQRVLAVLVTALVLLVMCAQFSGYAYGVTIPGGNGVGESQMDSSKYTEAVQLPVTLYDYGQQVGDTWVTKDPTVLNEGIAGADSTTTEQKDFPSTMRFWDDRYEEWEPPSDPSSMLTSDGHLIKAGAWRWGMFNRTFSDWSSIIAVPSRDLFGTSSSSCSYNGKVFKKVFPDVAMDFSYDPKTNTYHYSSNESIGTFDGSGHVQKTERLGNNSGKVLGFWPFGDYNSHFGMTMAFDFKLPSKEYLENHEYYFAFSGDDDLVVYVDDDLVLDLGGAHTPIAGYIDFANQIVVYGKGSRQWHTDSFLKYVEKSGIPFHRSGFEEAGVDWNMDTLGYVKFSDLGIDLANGKEHNFKLAYLERGGTNSNLMIEMNLDVVVDVNYKVVGDNQPDPEKTDAVPVETSELHLGDAYNAKPGLTTTDEGYSFSGWYLDEDCTHPWVDGTELSESTTTLYGKWEYGKPVKSSDPESGSEVQPLQQITYTVSYENTNDSAEQVEITDVIPEHTTYLAGSASSEGGDVDFSEVGDDGTGSLKATWDDLEPGKTAYLTFTVVVDEDAIGMTVENDSDVDVNNKWHYKTNKVEHKVVPANFKISKSSDPESGSNVTSGDTISYQVAVMCDSLAKVDEITVVDPVSDFLTLKPDTVEVTISNRNGLDAGTREGTSVKCEDGFITVSIPYLMPGETALVEYDAVVGEMSGVDERDIENTAYVHAPAIGSGDPTYYGDGIPVGAIASNTVVHHQKVKDPVSPANFSDPHVTRTLTSTTTSLPKTGDDVAGTVAAILTALGLVGGGVVLILRSLRKA
ncbi:MAG: InlB B-repeat-containing protein [Coriobacteriales bacterium]